MAISFADPRAPVATGTTCRFCGTSLSHVFADLGTTPLANSYLTRDELAQMEPFYPLRALVCESCFLVQLEDYETPEAIFSEYAYFSSYSTTWLEHSRRYAEEIVGRLGLGEDDLVVEVASNDGYLLQYFDERRIPVLGVEPAANVARVAIQKGIPTIVDFFGRSGARELAANRQADLLIANNVVPHVPDLNDFIGGLKILLKPGGVLTIELQHLQPLIENNEFDTIYHEHFSYFSFETAQRVLAEHGLSVFDVEELPTHGGSLRIYACHDDDSTKERTDVPDEIARRESEAGFDRLELYTGFAAGVEPAKRELLELFIGLKKEGKRIAGYGAPAKGNTLLNYCGIGTDFIEYTVDRNPRKQDRYLPGTRIPVRSPEAIAETRPDVIFILPWNLRDEVMEQLDFVREWGGRFVARVPELRLYP